MSVTLHNTQSLNDDNYISFEAFDTAGAVTMLGQTVLYFTNKEVKGTIKEIDITESEIFRSQSGNAYSGVHQNPRSFRFEITPRQDITFGKIRALLEAIRLQYRFRFKIYKGYQLYDVSTDSWGNYTLTFNTAVIEVNQPTYRENKLGAGTKPNPLELTVYESDELSLPDAEITGTDPRDVIVTEVRGLEIIQLGNG